jgi:RNA polymerase sigma-70 factor (ECF subfamily)
LSCGDINAFNILFGLYANRIYRFGLGYLKQECDAEELVQDVFLKVWEKRGEIKSELSFKSYLFTIAFNIIRNHFSRKAIAYRYFEHQVADDFDLGALQNIDYESTKRVVDSLVDQLSPKRKMVFVKSRYEGLSIKEIAAELGTTTKTVENQISEALKFMRDHLSSEQFGVLFFITLFYS